MSLDMRVSWMSLVAIRISFTAGAARSVNRPVDLERFGAVRVGNDGSGGAESGGPETSRTPTLTGRVLSPAVPREPGSGIHDRARQGDSHDESRTPITRHSQAFAVGDTESDAQAAYGKQLEVHAEQVPDNWHYLTCGHATSVTRS